jgi:hypothetical protein
MNDNDLTAKQIGALLHGCEHYIAACRNVAAKMDGEGKAIPMAAADTVDGLLRLVRQLQREKQELEKGSAQLESDYRAACGNICTHPS